MSANQRQGVSRREFVVQSGMVAGGAMLAGVTAAAWANASAQELPRRTLGRTGVSVTTFTLGTAPSGFTKPHNVKNVADCVNAAIDLGVNAIDTAPAYDIAEEGVGLALGKRRKDIFLSSKVLADDVAKAEKILANSLRLLKTDYLDLVYFHQVGDRDISRALDPDGVYSWLLKQKKAGKVRFVGISIHNRPDKAVPLLESNEVDVLLTVVNFVDRHTYHFEDNILPLARKHHAGIVAMKVFGGARKSRYADPNCPAQLDAEHLESAVRYALSIDGVATLNIGTHNVQQIRQDVELVKRFRPLTKEENTRLAALGKDLSREWGTHFGPLAGLSTQPDVYHV